jgi:hypothetical protein
MAALDSAALKPLEGMWRRDRGPVVVLLRGVGDELTAIVEAAELARDADTNLVVLATPAGPASLHPDRWNELQAMLDLAATGLRSELYLLERLRQRDVVDLCVARGASQLVVPGTRPPRLRLMRRLTRHGVRIVVTANGR